MRAVLTGRLCILGVGNRMKGDDGAGPELVGRLRGRVDAECIDAGIAPENFLEKIVRTGPEVVLIADAADFAGVPGEARLSETVDTSACGVSTHGLSLTMVAEYLRGRIPVRIYLLGIQPRRMALGEGLSEVVSEAVESVARVLEEIRGIGERARPERSPG